MAKIEIAIASGTTLRDAKLTMELIQKAIPKTEHRVKQLISDNPQVVLMRAKEEARLETLLAVESALLGNKVDLRMFSE